MVAVTQASPTQAPRTRAHRPQAHRPQVHRPHGHGADRPRLVVVRSTPTVRSLSGVPAATYRRRRAAAAAVALTVVLVLFLAVGTLRAPSGGPARAGVRPAVGGNGPVHVVQPGDTFWDIARSLRPDDDPRPLVARLVAAHGSPVLVVGERVRLPAGT